jgi:hypothetical protein
MGMKKVFNNPESGVQDEFIEFVNTNSAALAHGDVVVKDFSSDADAIIQGAVTTTSAYDPDILGVVWDPQGYGVAVGARGTLMVKGLHQSVKVASATYNRGDQLVTDTAAATVKVATAGGTVPGSRLGDIAKAYTAAATAAYVRIDIK